MKYHSSTRLHCRLNYLLLLSVGLISANMAAAQSGLPLLQKGTEQEAKITTGIIQLQCFSSNLMSKQLTSDGISNLTAIKEIHEKYKPQITEEYLFRFDNKNNSMWMEVSRSPDKVHGISTSSDQNLKQISIPPNGLSGSKSPLTQVDVRKPQWPPPFPQNLWRFRIVAGRLRVVNNGIVQATLTGKTNSSGNLIISIKGDKADIDQIISCDIQKGSLFSNIKLYDKKSGILTEDTYISYKIYKGGLIYLDSVIDKWYIKDATGKTILAHINTTQVIDAKLNVQLTPKDMAFGDYPEGATVQDNRFAKPIAYMQGKKQFTDEELFAALKNPDLLRSDYGSTSVNRPSQIPYFVLPMSLLLIVIALGVARYRKLSKSK